MRKGGPDANCAAPRAFTPATWPDLRAPATDRVPAPGSAGRQPCPAPRLSSVRGLTADKNVPGKARLSLLRPQPPGASRRHTFSGGKPRRRARQACPRPSTPGEGSTGGGRRGKRRRGPCGLQSRLHGDRPHQPHRLPHVESHGRRDGARSSSVPIRFRTGRPDIPTGQRPHCPEPARGATGCFRQT